MESQKKSRKNNQTNRSQIERVKKQITKISKLETTPKKFFLNKCRKKKKRKSKNEFNSGKHKE